MKGPGQTRKAERSLGRQLADAMSRLEKKPCIFYYVGPETGSFADLHFGQKVPRKTPLPHPDMSDEMRRFEGQLSLFLGCAWRLETPDEILAGCWDDPGPDGQMRFGLDQLIGQMVRRVRVVPPSYDLAIEFENGRLLRVFCDQTNDEEGTDNYAFFTPEATFVVGTLSELSREARDE